MIIPDEVHQLRALRERYIPKFEHYKLIEPERSGSGKEYRLTE